jgi:3-dehydroquinate synthase
VIRVPVRLRRLVDESHDIRIGRGLGARLSVDLRRRGLAARYVVVADRRLLRHQGRRLLASLRRRGLHAELVAIPGGEGSKTRAVRDRLEDALVRVGADRGTALIALGGGVTGDLTGFVAATFHRGIPHVQVPTTLLGMVDASIGGKTAINHPKGKNLIGAYHPPAAVYIDLDYLATLPARAYRSGLAEVVKCGVIADPALFVSLERHADRVLRRDLDFLVGVVEASVRLKARVVSGDPREAGRRVVLNFGHTIGHALETLSRYRLTHGEAVAIGMVLEARLAARAGLAPASLAPRLASLLRRFGLPVDPPRGLRAGALLRVARRDKKARQGTIVYALPARLGAMARPGGGYGIALDDGFVTASLEASAVR